MRASEREKIRVFNRVFCSLNSISRDQSSSELSRIPICAARAKQVTLFCLISRRKINLGGNGPARSALRLLRLSRSLQRETERGDFNDQKAARASQVPDRECDRLFSSPFDARPSFLIDGLFHFRCFAADTFILRDHQRTKEVSLRGPRLKYLRACYRGHAALNKHKKLAQNVENDFLGAFLNFSL